jgi:glycosyltransferase involved in cell wall biosynthesis
MSICLLDNAYAWFGKHAGWALLPENLALNGCPNTVIKPRSGLAARAVGKSYSIWNRHASRDQALAASELELLLRMRLSQSPGHVLVLEDHLKYLPVPSNAAPWVGTIHQPRRCWKPADLELLRALPNIFVLCDYMCDQFGDIFQRSQMMVLPHGVDTSFYKPMSTAEEQRPRKLVYVGAWLRNTAMLARLIPEINRRFPDVIFDLVVPLFARSDQFLSTLREHPSVRWHHNLSDEDLRMCYQTATAMFMPMEDGAANNAIVEALACGVPIITTDTGGIRSYGGGTLFPVVRNNDDSSFLDLAATYLTEPEFTATISRKCREFAETKLEWAVAAKEYIGAYRSLGFI